MNGIKRIGLGRGSMLAMAALGALTGCAVWTGSAFKPKQPVAPHLIIETAKDNGATSPSAATHPAVTEFQAVRVETAKPEPPPSDYRVGPNDTLFVNVYGLPELGSPSANISGSTTSVASPLAGASVAGGGRMLGSSVDGSGNIQLPLVDSVAVAGLTAREIQVKIREAFKRYIEKPWVVVEVVEHRSQPIYLVGQFNQPGVFYMDRPTTVVQAVAFGRGLANNADIRGARIQRGNKVLPVDIYRLLREGDFEQNVWLKPNDALYVPDNAELQVFVLGAVDRPGAIPMIQGRLDLLQALAQAGGQIKVGSALQYVRIIRSLSPTRGELMVVDVNKIIRGEATTLPLTPGDIVFIPRSTLGNWHDVFHELQPLLQTVSAAVQPFALVAASGN